MARSDLPSTSLTSRPARWENRDGERPRVVSENEIVDAQEQLAALGHENWHVRAAAEKRFDSSLRRTSYLTTPATTLLIYDIFSRILECESIRFCLQRRTQDAVSGIV